MKHKKSNINKALFNELFAQWLTIEDKQESNSYYSANIHPFLIIVAKNALHHWHFDCDADYLDMEAELIIYLLYKKNKGKLSNLKGNMYNAVFTIFRNRFRDLNRTKLVRQKREPKVDLLNPALIQETNTDAIRL